MTRNIKKSSDQTIQFGQLDLSEAMMYDSLILDDKDPLPNSSKIEFIEKDADALILGIKVDEKPHSDLLQGQSLVGIDGASMYISRSNLSLIVARTGVSAYTPNYPKLWSKIITEDYKLMISSEAIVKSNHQKIEKLPYYKNRTDSLNMSATQLQTLLETQTIPILFNQNEIDIDVFAIDGPLYFRNHIPESSENIKKVIDQGKNIFSIVKRSQDNSLITKLSQLAKKHAGLPSNFWYQTDREYLSSILSHGERTPYYIHVNSNEINENLPKNLQRVCAYLKLNSGLICRVEVPYELATYDKNLEVMDSITAMVYKLSSMYKGKLPQFMHQADKIAGFKKSERKKYELLVEKNLKSKGFPTKDPDNWK
jgi:hypothetical protein